ncbi:AAA family ATPase [Candidatus Woesearchaeota archaeon]|nr:AAA family ATPase [Candidatus Woesearchaeota archaeon]
MGLFDDALRGGESLFINVLALDYDFLPKLLPYRETQQRYVVNCIKPLLQDRTGKNVFIFGSPGIGKTTAVKYILNELEEETEEVIPVYVNCWQKNTSFKIILEICNSLGYKLTHNKKTDELFKIVKGILNKKAAVFAFDEVDKLDDFDFLYMILEDIYKKSVVLITNHKGWLDDLDDRIKSRLMPDLLEFKPYNLTETRGILRQRVESAFVPGVWEDDAFEVIVKKTAALEDIRPGLHLMREAGNNAEARSSKKIVLEDSSEAVKKLDEFSIKSSNDLASGERDILSMIKENSGKKIGELYEIYKKKGGSLSYKSFQRKIERLRKNKFISVEKKMGGDEGCTTIVKYKSVTKTLDEF